MTHVSDDKVIITIDGPAASGKSSVGVNVALQLELPFISSGLFYRAATYLVLTHGVSAYDETAVLALLNAHDVTMQTSVGSANRVMIDGRDVTAFLHTDDVDLNVSAVSKHALVREWVFNRLRDVSGDFVVEGRDMGTVVFPHAKHKFYLTAPAALRAQRRLSERNAELEALTEAIKRRDALDAKQLAPAADAVQIDTGDLSLEDVVSTVLTHVNALRASESTS